MDCGPSCLRMIAKHYGKSYSLQKLRELAYISREGVSMQGISDAAETIGFRTLGVKIPFETLVEEVDLPCIAHWNQNHFVVIYKITKHKVYVADPASQLVTYKKEEFLKSWVSDASSKEGIVLVLTVTPDFYTYNTDKAGASAKKGFNYLFKYLFAYKKMLIQLALGLLAGSLLQLVFPFLTQSVVDKGVQNQDIQFIYLVLLAQLMLFIGRTAIELIRGWILLHMSSRINISLVADFFIKLMRLPIAFFDSKMTGDIMQRIGDHYRIESFLTSQSLNVLFSFFNFIIFSIVLIFYNLSIFLVFSVGSVLYFLWIVYFLKRRAELDARRFSQGSTNQSKTMELVNGMQEIKLHNAERQKRWEWEQIQIKVFKTSVDGLGLSQIQNTGSSLINEVKNMLITFLSAKLVIDGQITLGMMLSISYIIGQLNAPVMQMIGFVQSWQDAKLSLERLSEIHEREDEETSVESKQKEIEIKDIVLKNVFFRYVGNGEDVLKNINLTVPANKVTAIVGTSGSGKTTLLKLLLQFYKPTQGEITIGHVPIEGISINTWRHHCGVVMQEGYIFSDTIANNIAVGAEVIDAKKLKAAVNTANIKEYIDELPLGYQTKIGAEGNGLSTGQKQRMLIARAVYKNPAILLFDEATSALDANNEKVIMTNLARFFENRTVLVIAHRLSTVKNADQIVVLEKGEIVEIGNHQELVNKKGNYYELIKNQLELSA